MSTGTARASGRRSQRLRISLNNASAQSSCRTFLAERSILGKSFCLRSRLGDPGKHHDRSVYETEDQNTNEFPPKNRDRELLVCTEVNKTHRTVRDRDYCVGHQGHKKTLRVSCTILRNQQKEENGTVVYVRDVTQKVLLEERLRRMERYIGLGSLAAGLQHEIKNPLSALSLHIQLLRERLSVEPPLPEVSEMLDILHTEVNRISNVLDGFRNYASLNTLGRTPVVIGRLIVKLVRLLRPQAESQSIAIVVDIPANPVGTVMADSVQLEQVLLNLALNAIAAMPGGGTLTFKVTRQDTAVRIDVIDTGHGIATEVKSQIFDPYFTTRPEGTGMGLALCHKIVQQHGGTIDFRSGDDRGNLPGTEFTVLLPLDDPA